MKLLWIFFKTLKILLGILLILYIALFTYISINKSSIIKQVTAEIEKKMNGKVSVKTIDLSFFREFPNVSVLLNDVIITDSMFEQHKHAFFQADHVFGRLSIMKLIKKQSPLSGLTLEKGSFYLYTDTTGYSNSYLLKQKTDSIVSGSNKGKNEIESIILKEVNFTIEDKQREKLHSFYVNDLDITLNDKDDVSFIFTTRADILIHSLAFNLPKGSFLKEKRFTGKFRMQFNKQLYQLHFDSIDIKLSGHPFNLSGRFDLKGDAAKFGLRAHTKDIHYNEGRSLMTDRIARSLSMVELDKPLDVDADISGPVKGGEPLIYVNWKTSGTHFKTPFLDFDNASFTGHFSNEVMKGLPRFDPNSLIDITNFSAYWHDIQLVSRNIEILNLDQPVLTCDLSAGFPLTKLNDLLGSNVLQLTSGDVSVDITYKGPLENNSNTNSFINGFALVKNGTVLYAPRDVEMKNVNGKLSFKNSAVFVENLQCNVLKNKIVMEGEAKDLLTLINTDPRKASIDWKVSSPSLNLGSFIYLLKAAKKPIASLKSKTTLASAASGIDNVLEQASLHIKLDATKLYYKKFEAGNVQADITLLEDKYIINNVSMEHAGGNINMSGSIIKQQADHLQAILRASMENVDVSKVFYAFGNFGQDGITAENLEGKLTAKIDASLGLDEEGKLFPNSIESIVDFSLKDGALINYEPVKKLQNILLRNRDFENIRFAELKDRLEIRNREIKINRMEIQSTVLSFFTEGIYSLKGNTDISIQVPLNNLKKRGIEYNPENIGTDKKGGKSIYARGRPGADGKVNFKIDLFNRYKKGKG